MKSIMPKKTTAPRPITKKGDEGLTQLMSPGVLAKVQAPPEPEKEEEISFLPQKEDEEIAKIDVESLFGAALIAIGIGVLIGLAFAFIMRDSSGAMQIAEEGLSLADMIPQ